MSYLQENEIEEYCGLVNGVTMQHVEAASALIDAFKGCSLFEEKHTEKVTLSKTRCDMERRGKLRHFPRVEIKSISSKVRSVFGASNFDFPINCIEFDGDNSVYFSFYMPVGMMFQAIPKELIITYISGYREIPEQVKRACGILAGNIKQMGGVMKWKSRDDYDIKVTLSNEGIFSEEIRALLRGVKVQ